MQSSTEQASCLDEAVLPGRWTVCALLFVATTINYIDRQVLSILKPVLSGATLHLQPLLPGWPTVESSIRLTDAQYGNVLAAFQVAYALGVVFAGRMVDRLGCRKGYPIVTGLWSMAAMGHALVNSISGFIAARFLLGLGESGNFPSAVKATAEWFSPKERALATGIFNSGASVGAILAPLAVPWATLHFGWRASFLLTGIFSVLWIVAWSLHYRTPAVQTAAPANRAELHTESAQAWWSLLVHRQAWAFILGKFFTDPVWWFFLFWLPQYFSSRFHIDLTHLGPPLVVVYAMSTVGSIWGGWLPKGFLHLGMGMKPARLVAMLICACLVLPVAFAGAVQSLWVAVVLLSLAAAAHQGWSANIYTTASDMFPGKHVATVVSFGQVSGALGGAIFQPVVGHILQWTHSFVPLFLYSSVAYLAALGVVCVLAPRLRSAQC